MMVFDDHEIAQQLRSVDVVETTDEDGQVHYFEPVDELEVDGQLYALLVYQGTTLEPVAETEDEDGAGYSEEFVVMRIVMEGDERLYESIDDDAEFERVISQLEKMDFHVDMDESLEMAAEHLHDESCNHHHNN
jgi:Protein of unknown function (DUF1292)